MDEDVEDTEGDDGWDEDDFFRPRLDSWPFLLRRTQLSAGTEQVRISLGYLKFYKSFLIFSPAHALQSHFSFSFLRFFWIHNYYYTKTWQI